MTSLRHDIAKAGSTFWVNRGNYPSVKRYHIPPPAGQTSTHVPTRPDSEPGAGKQSHQRHRPVGVGKTPARALGRFPGRRLSPQAERER